MPHPSDSVLVEAILGGAVQRYSEVVARFHANVRAILRRETTDPGELEELVQETFYLGFRDLAALDSPERLGGWLRSIARRRLAERRRVRARTRWETRSMVDETTEDQDDVALWEEVDHLPGLLAAVLQLRYREDLSYREIADRLNVPVSTVRGRIYEARKALRTRLDRLEKP